MARNATLTAPSRSCDYRREIGQTLTDLRLAQRQGGYGPDILYLVNELAILFEDMFCLFEQELHQQDGVDITALQFQHEAFLADFCDLAEEIRTNNGEIPNAFFSLVETGPYAGPALAA